MKPSRAFWGTLLVVFGLMFLIGRFYAIEFDTVWKFWPLVFVLLGLAIVFKQPAVKLVLSSLAALVAAIFLYAVVSFEWLPWHGGYVLEDDEAGKVQVQEFTEPMVPDVRTASFRMDMAAGKFKVDTANDELVHATVKSGFARYNLVRSGTPEDVDLHLDQQEEVHVKNWRSRNAYSRVEVYLNPKPEWDLSFDIGAASVTMDLSGMNVREMNIDGGAADLDLTLGVPSSMTSVRCDMGASKIRIAIPESVGCEVRLDGDLSSKRLENFSEYDEDIYRTENYASASKKILIDAKTGLASVRIERY